MKDQKIIRIKKGSPLFKELKWVSKAVSTDKFQPQLLNLQVFKDDRTLVATDGRRLHTVEVLDENLDLPDSGAYEIISNTAKEIMIELVERDDVRTYPQWRSVIPDSEVSEDYEIGHNSVGLISGFCAKSSIAAGCTVSVNDSYLSDILGEGTLLKDKEDSLYWKIGLIPDKGEYKNPLLLESVDYGFKERAESDSKFKRLAVLMPIRYKRRTREQKQSRSLDRTS